MLLYLFVLLEHSTSLCKVYSDNSEKLQEKLKEQSLRCKLLLSSNCDELGSVTQVVEHFIS